MHASSSTKTRDQSPGKALPAQDAHGIFGDFDLSQLKDLAKQFVNTMYVPGVGLEKAMLQGLFERTLHSEPAKRIADLSRLPIMGIWNKTPGDHSLKATLATHTISGEIQYSMFNKADGPYVPWPQQQQLLQDLDTVALKHQSQKKNGVAVFQTALCYINAFGTSRNYGKGAQFLRQAIDEDHPDAEILGPRILYACSESLSPPQKAYYQSLAVGFGFIHEFNGK